MGHTGPSSDLISIKPLVLHELRQLLRDGRFWWVGAIIVALTLSSGVFGWSHATKAHAERIEAQKTAASQWASQGDKNPHAAAHYGIYVFKPVSGLSFIDPGVEPSLGVTVKLQAHKRSALQGTAAQDSTALKHFGRLSPVSILQMILPLLIIGLGFTAWSAERDRGTLRQIMSYGVSPKRLLWGKVLGLGLALGLLVVPIALIGLIGVLWMPGASVSIERGLALVGIYGIYMFIYLCGAIWMSAVARTSRVALIVLLGFWGVTSLIVPRLAGNVIDAAIPMPSAVSFATDLKESMENGLPGGEGREDRVEVILGDILKKEGFEGGLLMMEGSLLQGLELEAEAVYEREVFDHHFSLLNARSNAQAQALQWVSLLSPFVAVRALSMGFSGTDLAHHQDFSQHAETYRRGLISQLNREFAERGGSDGWAYKANRALWEKATPFEYTSPQVAWVFERQLICLLILIFWLGVTGFGAWWSARHLRVV